LLAEPSLKTDRDPLTELWNRSRFDEELRQRLNEARRYEEHGAVLLIDLDALKKVNDTFGPSVGDAAVKRVAGALVRVTRDSDFVARLGGGEFAVLLPRSDAAGARRCAERILADLAIGEKAANGQRSSPIGASIGIALFPAHATEPDVLLQCADHALHLSKDAGRNRATLHEPPITGSPVLSVTRLRNADIAPIAAALRAQGEE
jgi:diguanylate cyclase (GGDEF)-like protein